MKETAFTKTENVKKALKYIDMVRNRDVTRMVGLMLIYGIWGLGKTWFGERFAGEHGFIFLRLDATMREKDFLKILLSRINEQLGVEERIQGTTHELLIKVRNKLNEHFEELPVIIIDEIDYAISRTRLLGTIRDIADSTITTVIMLGMKDAYIDLQKKHSYFFDRNLYLLEFKSLSEKDVRNSIKDVSEVVISEKNIEAMIGKTEGNFRKVIKMVNYAEQTDDDEKFSVLIGVQ